MHYANQTVTVQLQTAQICEHGRLGWVAEPVLNTEVNKLRKTGNSEKEMHTEKTPRSLGKSKKKNCFHPKKFEVTIGMGWYRFNYLNLKL